MTRKHDYAVGYARPPQHTRFQKGTCPNRKGRPRKGTSFKDERERVLQEPITITKNGRPVRVSAREAMLLRLRSLALEGNLRAMEMLMKLQLANENGPASAGSEDVEPLPGDDQDVIDRFLARKRVAQVKSEDTSDE